MMIIGSGDGNRPAADVALGRSDLTLPLFAPRTRTGPLELGHHEAAAQRSITFTSHPPIALVVLLH